MTGRQWPGSRFAPSQRAVGNDVNEWLTAEAVGWRHLLSVRPTATPAQPRMSLPGNRALVERGLEMVSVFDDERLDDECRRMLVEEPVGDSLFAVADVQMKVIDHERVLEQAMHYWNTVLASAFECGREQAEVGSLSERQQRVVGLMRTGMTDEAIARQLHVSVRTVRSEVARILETLQVRSRFSAGCRLGRGEVLPD